MISGVSGWMGSARMGIGWGLFVGRAGDNSPHSHHALQIVLADTVQRVWTAAGGWQEGLGIVIGANVAHRLEASEAPVTLLYLDPDSSGGRRAASGMTEECGVLKQAVVNAALSASLAGIPNPAASIVETLFPAQQTPPPGQRDELIEHWIARLPHTLPTGLRIAALSAQAGLSASRLQHRFRAHTGLAMRPYLRWRRLLTALDAVTRGLPLTDAALEAGFADAAHFTRTFRRHFGIAPSVLLRLGDRT